MGIMAVTEKASSPRAPSWLLSPRVQVSLLCAVTAAAYLGVVEAGFVWDDQAIVLGNSLTGDVSNLWSLFGADLWNATGLDTGTAYYRPMMLLSLMADRIFFGLNAAEHHLHSLAWHLLAVVLLHRLLLRLSSPLPALAGATLFALHPVQSEAIVWISARNDLMAAAFLLAALLLLLPDRCSPRRLLAGSACTLAALLSKESAILAPFLLLALDLARHGRLRGPPRHAAAWLAVAIYVFLRFSAGVPGAPSPPTEGLHLVLDRFPQVMATYGQLLAWPWPLSGGRDLESLSLSPTATALGLLVLFLLAALLLLPRAGRALAAVGLTWAAFTFAPALLAIASKGLLGERYLYLPMAGLALATACPRRPVLLAAILLWPLPWLGIIHLRLPDWKDDVSLWSAALRDTPSTYVQAGLGHALMHADRPLAAHAHFRLAMEGQPPRTEACPNVIGSALAAGRPDLAVSGAEMAASRGCDSPVFNGFRSVALAMNGEWEPAAALASSNLDDPVGRSALVLASWGIVRGDCAPFRQLIGGRTDAAHLKDQVMRILLQGGYETLARNLADGRGSCPP